jgi:large subunit ribosomal protein L22
MKAFLKNYRQSPRKVRLVTELIKGKRVAEGFVYLENLPKKASVPMKRLLSSAVSNAKNLGISEDNLYIENITVNKGIVLKRMMPRARGSASRINRRTSHVLLTLKEKEVKAKKESKVKTVKKEVEETKSKEVKSKSKITKTTKKPVAKE